jgi:WD40 repeat protein/tRNA A-37 threonylcarbamoyl transferase component Bud32
MSEPSDQPTQKRDGPPPDPPNPPDAETRDAPRVPPEPGTLTAGTRTNHADPPTASMPPAGAREPVVEPPGFAIVRELGSGGMGVVYEARQTRLSRPVALKVLRGRGSAQDVVRFLAEAEAIAAIKHPHVVQVYEFGQHAGGPFMALELLTGGTLSERLRTAGRLAPGAAAELVAKLAGAVQAAHDLGIVHRDLKPGNVLFDEAGTAKVTDFGLAKKAGGSDLTRTQAVMGTPAYMAPEQARGEARFVGPAVDVWALGAILYECLTGKRAFEADDTWAVLRKVTDEAPPAPRTHAPDLPRDLELIALKCLEKSPTDRYPTAAALAADLENYRAGRPVSVRPAGAVERTLKWVRRNPAIAGAAAAVALALVVGSAVSLAFGLEARRRGRDLERANAELSRTNGDLTKSRDDLTRSRDDLMRSRNDLAASVRDVERAQADAEDRGYLSNVALAHQLWKANDLTRMRGALERCPPNRRRWEWHHLDRLGRPEREVIATDSVPLALAYSPDGKRLAWFTRSGTLTVRELATGRESLFTIDYPTGINRVLAFRPDGTEIAFAVGARFGVAKLDGWAVKELTPMKDGRPTNSAAFLALGYTRDGRLLGATAENPGPEKEWVFANRDVAADRTVAILPTGVKPAHGVVTEIAGAEFGPDCTRLAVSVVDSGIRVGKAGEPAKFEPFRPVLLVCDVATEKVLHRAEGGGGLFQQLVFAPNGDAVGFGHRPSAGELGLGPDGGTRFVGNHSGDVRAVAFDRTGLIWSAGEDKFIAAHDRKTGTERLVVRGCPNGVYRLAVSPDGREIAAAEGDIFSGGSVRRFDVAALLADAWQSPAPRDRVSLVTALAPDATRFAAVHFAPADEGPGASRFVIRAVNGGTERPVAPAEQWMFGAFRPDGGLFVLSRNDRLRFIDRDGKPGAEIALPGGRNGPFPALVACAPNGRTVAVVTLAAPEGPPNRPTRRARVLTWDADTREPGPTATADLSAAVPPDALNAMLFPTAAAFDAEGHRLAASFTVGWEKGGRGQYEFRGAVVVWEATSGKELFRQVTPDPMRAVGFDPLGRVVAGGGSTTSGVVLGWDRATGAEVFSLRGHSRPVMALAFGPSGRLATGGADRVVKVWDTAGRREVLTFDGFAREVTHVAFAPGGELVAATGLDLMSVMTAGPPTDWPPAEVRVFRGAK